MVRHLKTVLQNKQNRNRLINTKNRLMVAAGDGAGRLGETGEGGEN